MRKTLNSILLLTLVSCSGSHVYAQSDTKTVTDSWPACVRKADFERVADYMTVGDNEAAGRAILSSSCVLLRRGEKVYRTEVELSSGAIKIRRPGQTVEYWTFVEAVR